MQKRAKLKIEFAFDERMAEAVRGGFNAGSSDRIRDLSETTDGQPIDAPSQAWTERKKKKGAPGISPGYYMGSISDPENAWETKSVTPDKITIKLNTEAEHTAHVYGEIGKDRGKNWDKVVGTSIHEEKGVIDQIENVLKATSGRGKQTYFKKGVNY